MMGSGTSKTKRPRLRIRKPLSDQDWRDWANEVHAGHMRATDMQNHRGQWVTLRANTQAGVLEYFEGGEWRGLGYGAGGGAAASTEAEAELPNHNLLPGLQGGAPWRGEYYHLQRAAHDELGRFWDGGQWDLSGLYMADGHVDTLHVRGKVGIGEAEASPSYALHVQKTVASGDQRTLAYLRNPASAVGGFAALTLEADTALATATLAMHAAAYSGITGWGNRAALYSGSQADGMIVAANKGAVEFWVLETVVSPPSSTWHHVADANNTGIVPAADGSYILGSENGPLRWADASFDQVHINSFALTMSGAAALSQDLLTTSGPTFDHVHAGSTVLNDTLVPDLRSGVNISGGGTVSWVANKFKWTARLIVISNGRGSHFSTSGYFDIAMPTSGTCTGVGGASDQTWGADGITLTSWQALYYILPIGSGNATVSANFRIASYTATPLVVPENWVLLAIVNGDTPNHVKVPIGIRLEAGESQAAGHDTNFGGRSSLALPSLAAPSLSAEGQSAWDSDDDKLLVHDGAAAVCIAAKVKQLSFIVKAPQAADDFLLIQFKRAVTIVGVYALAQGGTNVIGCLDEYAGDGATLQAAIDGDWTITTAEFSDTSFTNAALDAGDWLKWHTTSVSGVVSFLTVTVEYYES